ncbi:MAG: ATP-binding protein [Methanobrevibacter sp.]|jgi:predicted AAA+ superfamily ATPase|nr:ATP-binding protein [Candidatus Methanoflexus mossambicus]
MVKRELYLKKIRPLINKDIIKVITGIRRCGKSYMLNLIKEELLNNHNIKESNIILINLESTKYNMIKSDLDLNEIVFKLTENLSGKIYLFFDEIQNVDKWEKSINGYRVDLDCDIYITGSNAELLSGELATLIAGRYMEIKMYPFSFKEALLFEKEKIKSNKKEINETQLFDNYIKYGGMPFIFHLEESEKLNYLKDLYNSILLKDIIQRNKIRDIDLLDRLLKYLIDNIGHTFSALSISKYLKSENRNVSRETIYNYLFYCINGCLIFKVPREDLIGKKLLKISEKYYLTDHGFNQSMAEGNKQNIGQILENIVYMELVRRGYDITIGKANGYEIDFVCKKNKNKIYIQVSYILADEEVIKREFRPLMKIKDSYPKYVLSLDEFDLSKEGIRHLNIKEFLKTDEL